MLLGNNLHDIRKSKNMTMLQLAKKSGVSHTTISSIENDIKIPKLTTALEICKVLHSSIDELFFERKF